MADGGGGHAFSETLAQHQTNVAKLRLLEQQQRGEAAAGATDAAPADATITTPAFAPAQPSPARSRQQDRASGARSSSGARP